MQTSLKVIPVPCLSNNYAYMWVRQLLLLPQLCRAGCCSLTALACRLSNSKSNKALVVDPVEPRKVLDAAQQAGLDVAGCLTTHHHA